MRKTSLNILYFTGFLVATHSAFIAYINSSFLSQFTGEGYIGIIFALGAIAAILLLSKTSSILYRFGNFKTTLIILILEVLSLLSLAFIKSAWVIIPVFIIHYAFLILLKFGFDVFIEHFSRDEDTGSIRGTFLTIANIGWVLSPALAGWILSDSEFWKVYLISAIILLPVIIVMLLKFRNIPENHYDHPPFWKTLKEVWNNKDVYKIFIISLLLYFFFGWMVIYTPIYLSQYIGFSWDKIGLIFTLMLIPYILFEIPLGKLADWRFGEKEFLSIGFIITAMSTMAIAFISSTNFIVWAGILFLTRIGASFIEIMSETYFFKQIDDTDIHIISFFRNTRPLAYIIAPLIATILLEFIDFRYLFVALALILLSGLKYSLTLRDTK